MARQPRPGSPKGARRLEEPKESAVPSLSEPAWTIRWSAPRSVDQCDGRCPEGLVVVGNFLSEGTRRWTRRNHRAAGCCCAFRGRLLAYRVLKTGEFPDSTAAQLVRFQLPLTSRSSWWCRAALEPSPSTDLPAQLRGATSLTTMDNGSITVLPMDRQRCDVIAAPALRRAEQLQPR